MFDIGFWELFAVAVIALLVLGPDRIPGAVRGASYWWGRVQRYGQHLRTELIEATEVEEIKDVKSILNQQQDDFKEAATRMRKLAQEPSWEQFDAGGDEGGAEDTAGSAEGDQEKIAPVAAQVAAPAPARKRSAPGGKTAPKKKTAAAAGKSRAAAGSKTRRASQP